MSTKIRPVIDQDKVSQNRLQAQYGHLKNAKQLMHQLNNRTTNKVWHWHI